MAALRLRPTKTLNWHLSFTTSCAAVVTHHKLFVVVFTCPVHLGWSIILLSWECLLQVFTVSVVSVDCFLVAVAVVKWSYLIRVETFKLVNNGEELHCFRNSVSKTCIAWLNHLFFFCSSCCFMTTEWEAN